MALLELTDVAKTYRSAGRTVPAVRGVDLALERGRTVGLVGESGCGKSTLGRIIAGLHPQSAGVVTFDGLALPHAYRDRAVRRRVQMVFQHPYQSLNPRMRVEAIIAEPLRLLAGTTGREADRRVDEVLQLVGLDATYRRRLPRELSGGQQQRVAIARALVSRPDLVVLDEPTSGLDQSVRGRIVALLRHIQAEEGVAYLFISHDLDTVRRLADEVAVMYLGRIVERATTAELFAAPRHPYTRALLSAVPSMDPRRRGTRVPLAGETPSPSELPVGCAFASRCVRALDRCRAEQPELAPDPISADRLVECFNPVPQP
ncbi:oligopeptide/dipeptide ABC transporter ATP-binding protein [Dactylosporangium sp. NPDC000521]|uniref:oligopeptide/dipeptide ABC transporter ATP-binding protein n=1 Tax=Dactylosporangium sp. NPDC000521 TaxID=3363975 RepID=UPI0036822AEC